jgi:sugar phosphate isomerase/epimerase
MIIGGLVSVTFRQLQVDEIISLVKETSLTAIEWGGDVHVPHGDISVATDTRKKTVDADLCVSSYGSYYRVGHQEPMPFSRIIETAQALGAPMIRVWAGKRNSQDADSEYWQRVVEDTLDIATLASKFGLSIGFEYHNNTLTNTLDSTLRLLKDVNHKSVTTYWQPSSGESLGDKTQAIQALKSRLSNVHISTGHRALAKTPHIDAESEWEVILKTADSPGIKRYALIEFVQDNKPVQFVEDAALLNYWLSRINN